jgi:hypothetical protein
MNEKAAEKVKTIASGGDPVPGTASRCGVFHNPDDVQRLCQGQRDHRKLLRMLWMFELWRDRWMP